MRIERAKRIAEQIKRGEWPSQAWAVKALTRLPASAGCAQTTSPKSMFAGAAQGDAHLASVQLHHISVTAFVIRVANNQLHRSVAIQIGDGGEMIGPGQSTTSRCKPDGLNDKNVLRLLADRFANEHEGVI